MSTSCKCSLIGPNPYWAPLADTIHHDVLTAMSRAEHHATHHGGGRDGEPILMAGVRELLQHLVPVTEARPESDPQRRVAELESEVRRLQFNADEWKRRHDAVKQYSADSAQDAQATLARVAALLDHRRKTVRMDDLRAALYPSDPRETR